MKLLSVKPLEPYTLELIYSDFMKFEVDINPLIARGKVFKLLENKALFNKAKVSEAGDAVTWGEVDLDAQNLRLEGEKHVILSRQNLLSEQLRQLLEASNLSQSELAQRIGTQQPNVARMLQDDFQNHTIATLQKIADATGKRLEIRFL
jgi:predicted XRE-type DNA-binding protein